MEDLDQTLVELDSILASMNETDEIGYTGLLTMEKCAETDVGLRALYSRCAVSPLVAVKNAFSFTLAKRSRIPAPVVGDIALSFVEGLNPPFTPQVFLNTFTMIENNYVSGVKWGSSPTEPRNLIDIIKTALDFSGEMALVVRDAAISVLIAFDDLNESIVIGHEDREWIREQVNGLGGDDISPDERTRLLSWLSPN